MKTNSVKIVLPHILVQTIVLILITKVTFIFLLYKISEPAGWLMITTLFFFNFPVLWVIIILCENLKEKKFLSMLSKESLIIFLGIISAFSLQISESVVHSRIIDYPFKAYLIKEAGINSLFYILPVLIAGEIIRNRKSIKGRVIKLFN